MSGALQRHSHYLKSLHKKMPFGTRFSSSTEGWIPLAYQHKVKIFSDGINSKWSTCIPASRLLQDRHSAWKWTGKELFSDVTHMTPDQVSQSLGFTQCDCRSRKHKAIPGYLNPAPPSHRHAWLWNPSIMHLCHSLLSNFFYIQGSTSWDVLIVTNGITKSAVLRALKDSQWKTQS